MESTLRDRTDPGLRIIETMLWRPGEGLQRGALHLARAERTCAVLGFVWDGAAVSEALAGLDEPSPVRLRMTIGRDGDVEITHQPFVGGAVAPAVLEVSPERLDPEDPFLRIKTTRRALYDRTLREKPAGVDEVLFLNTRGELCEGAYTNLFLTLGGRLVTPALGCGLLPGVLRESLLRSGEVCEAVLTPRDLAGAEAIWIGNSLRGLRRAALAEGVALP